MYLHLTLELTRIQKGKLTDYRKIVASSIDTPEYRERLLNKAKEKTNSLFDSGYTYSYGLYSSSSTNLTTKSQKLF